MRSSIIARFRQFLVYFIIGGFVGVVGIGIREAVALLLPDTPAWYATSVGIAYGASILASFSLHSRITFAGALNGRGTAASFTKFSIIAVIGLITSIVLAPAIRYGLRFDALFGARGAFLAFVIACLLVSVISYLLNASFTFSSSRE
jgi:putative flippase GtrA